MDAMANVASSFPPRKADSIALWSRSAPEIYLMSVCDPSRTRAARLLVIQRLEEYGYADSVIIDILGISKSTFHRLIEGRYLKRRAAKDEHLGDRIIAKDLAVIVLIRGDYSVAEILSAIKSSQADIYRRLKEIRGKLSQFSESDRAWIARWISRNLLSEWEPLPVRGLQERRRRERWIRPKRAGQFS